MNTPPAVADFAGTLAPLARKGADSFRVSIFCTSHRYIESHRLHILEACFTVWTPGEI